MSRKLLILGYGGHGKVVYETAMSMIKDGKIFYDSIDFLDDNAPKAVGKIINLAKFKGEYDEVFCGIGNNRVRKELLQKAEKLDFSIATLVHATAYVSPTATVEKGTIIEAKAIVNANSIIKSGCIISVGAIVDHDVIVEEYSHVNTGAICKAGSHIETLRKIDSGEVVQGYPPISR